MSERRILDRGVYDTGLLILNGDLAAWKQSYMGSSADIAVSAQRVTLLRLLPSEKH
jgi:hypothetical protein